MGFSVRQAEEEDLGQVQLIFEHYVKNSVVTFMLQRPPPSYVQIRFKDSLERQLPYLVALSTSNEGTEKLVGYAYASGFRGFMLGYGHTAEITIFCDPEYTDRGVGSLMMSELLKRLRTTTHISRESGHEDNPVEFKVKKVVAIMALDETGLGGGLALRNWYQKWGFEEVGRLKKVGHKMGREYVYQNDSFLPEIPPNQQQY